MSILKTAQTNLENTKKAKQLDDNMRREEMYRMAKDIEQKAANSLAASDYVNRDIGYGITAREMAAHYGIPVNELSNVLQQQDEAYRSRGEGYGNPPSSDEVINNYASEKRAYIDNAIAKNREYNVNRGVKKPQMPSGSDAAFYAADGIDVYKDYDRDMDEFSKAQALTKAYEDNIDKSLAAEWMKSYKGR